MYKKIKNLKIIKWYEIWKGEKVQWAGSPDGEKRCGPYLVDGFVDNGVKGKAIEVHGLVFIWRYFLTLLLISCYWHAHKKCFPCEDKILGDGYPASFIRQRHADRMEFLRSNFDQVEEYWECEIEEMKSRGIKAIRNVGGQAISINMKEYMENLPDVGPINYSDAFHG